MQIIIILTSFEALIYILHNSLNDLKLPVRYLLCILVYSWYKPEILTVIL